MEGSESRGLYDLCALLLTVLRSPPGSGCESSMRRALMGPAPPLTPTAIASVLVGASLAMVLGGSVTFVIGIMMMPWVIGFVIFLYFVGVISSLKSLGMAVLCPGSSATGSGSSPKAVNGASSPKYLSNE